MKPNIMQMGFHSATQAAEKQGGFQNKCLKSAVRFNLFCQHGSSTFKKMLTTVPPGDDPPADASWLIKGWALESSTANGRPLNTVPLSASIAARASSFLSICTNA